VVSALVAADMRERGWSWPEPGREAVWRGPPYVETGDLQALRERGVSSARIETVYSPAWTTEWMSGEAREKLRAYGIAAPGHVVAEPLVSIGRRREAVECPFCGSRDTTLTSEFSSTACKAMHMCNACTQPFEEFKAI